mgnify:CR=1 FL=1
MCLGVLSEKGDLIMGIPYLPVYGEDLATDIETAKKLLEKIESRTATEKDFKEFEEVSKAIVNYASKN